MEAVLAVVIPVVGTIAVGVLSLMGRKKETAATSQAEFMSQVLSRLDSCESRIESLQSQLDKARRDAMCAEHVANQMSLATTRGLHALRAIAQWIRQGAEPPPPNVDKTISELEAAIDAVSDRKN